MDGNRKGDSLVIFQKRLFEKEVLVVQDVLTVTILHDDPKRFHIAVQLVLDCTDKGSAPLSHQKNRLVGHPPTRCASYIYTPVMRHVESLCLVYWFLGGRQML